MGVWNVRVNLEGAVCLRHGGRALAAAAAPGCKRPMRDPSMQWPAVLDPATHPPSPFPTVCLSSITHPHPAPCAPGLQGTLRVSRFNAFQGWLSSESVGQDILIAGRLDMNRAMDGDVVAGGCGGRGSI